ncbi:hypothetical protein [Rhizobium azibense]|uniref:hypothetical protein n=1 Tax=Rhizobium azibense TaxID=1136135 RepID=UPI001051EC17|nr:hypothetical protein [Rhizobium azibense]
MSPIAGDLLSFCQSGQERANFAADFKIRISYPAFNSIKRYRGHNLTVEGWRLEKRLWLSLAGQQCPCGDRGDTVRNGTEIDRFHLKPGCLIWADWNLFAQLQGGN